MTHSLRQAVAILALTLVSLELLLSGCSGGTTGTGRPATIVTGRVFSADGSPLPDGTIVTILESGDSAPLLDGSFAITVSERQSTISLLIESSNIQSTATIPDVPDDALVIEVEVRLRPDGTADVTNTEVTTPPDDTPTAIPSVIPSAQPTTAASPTPRPSFTNTPIFETPTPKPTSTVFIPPNPVNTNTPTPTPAGMGSNNTPTVTPIPSATI